MLQVDVSGNSLQSEGKQAIGNALLSNARSMLGFMKCDEWELHMGMTSFDVSGKGLTAADGVLLAGVLRHNNVVTVVDVSNNNLGTEGGKALAAGLKDNTTITQVG